MSDNIIIRPAVIADISALVRLAHELAESEGEQSLISTSVLEVDCFEDKTHAYLVAQQAEEIVGFVMYYAGYDLQSASRGVHLGDICVTKSVRGQGVGRMLLAELGLRILADGGEWMSWTMLKGNVGAREFYKALGAKRVRDVEFWALGKSKMREM